MTFAGLALTQPLIMGIVNVTPDSFSDGGETLAVEKAIARGITFCEQGADILDVGGESTRPGAASISIDEELKRVIPVVQGLVDAGATVSIDTRHATVMTAAVQAGAQIINDVTALTGGPNSLVAAANSGAAIILMHMLGEPGTMQDNPVYDNAAKDVYEYLANRIRICESAGISRAKIAIDPGIGFGKTVEHNLEILGQLNIYRDLDVPVVLGVSRKSFIGHVSVGEGPKDRVPGSLAAALVGVAQGVHIVRVHDIAETRQALAVYEAINKGSGHL
ncbi:MAG: dihydropteroate synthase [Rhodospirillales bacterium]|jgi:dihydropteroate synthase